MSALILLIASALAAPYQEQRVAAEADDRLVPGDTAVLVGLAGELGCVASHDPVDCEVLRSEPGSAEPVVELIPVPALVLPGLAGEPPALLLPRFPYGLGEPVTPVLGPLIVEHPKHSWVRLPLPADAALRFGPGQAELLVTPTATGPGVEPFTEPVGPPETVAVGSDLTADAWPTQLAPYTRTQVLMPLVPVAVRVQDDDGVLLELAWPEAAPTITGQPLAEPAWALQATGDLALATGLCMRAYYAESLRRPQRGPPVPPSALPPPILAVVTDELGQVLDAQPIGQPWERPEPAACLRANARLLSATAVVSSLAVLELSAPPAAPAPADPAPSSR